MCPLFIKSVVAVLVAVLSPSIEGLVLAPRVIGGVSISNRCIAPYNSMVALQFYSGYLPLTFCSAVMITDTYLVTTASCIFKIAENKDKEAVAVIGERDTMMSEEPEKQRIGIKNFKVHYNYNRTTGDNDIALIQLAQPARLGRCVKPVARMEKDPNACEDVDDSCVMVGWGSYSESQERINSRLPRAAAMTVYNDLITVLLSSKDPLPPVGSLYAETINPRQKACLFDWGNIVSCRRNGYNVFRGIVSNYNCKLATPQPILIVDIPYYQFWIDRCTSSWDSCAYLRS